MSMLSTKSKIQLLIVLLNDIKNDVGKYSNGATFESLSVFEGVGKPLLKLLDNNGKEIDLSFNEKGKLVANTGDESKDTAIERKYKINWILKVFSLIAFFAFNMSVVFAQTPPARTWYENNRGVKTTVKERWQENSQGQKHGTYIKYFEDGEREILGQYKNDIPNGQWEITVYSNLLFQQVKSITYVNFLNGQEHGLYKTVSGNTVLVQGNYNNGKKTGYWKEEYDEELKIYQEGNYVNGKRDGEWKNTCVIKKDNDELAVGMLFGNLSSSNSQTKLDYKTIYKNGEVISSVDKNGKPAGEVEVKEITNSNGNIIARRELIKTDSKSQDFSASCSNPPYKTYRYTEFDENGKKIIEGEFYNKTNCIDDYRNGQWYFEKLEYNDISENVNNNLVFFRGDEPLVDKVKYPILKSNVVFEDGKLVFIGTLQEYNDYKIKRDKSESNFIQNPTIENLKIYENITKETNHSNVLTELKQILSFSKEVSTDGYKFELPFSKYSDYDSCVYKLYESILKPYHLTYLFPYVLTYRYNYERIDNKFTIYTNPKTKQLQMQNERWNIRYFIGDKFATVTDLNKENFYVLKNDEQICECDKDEPFIINNATKSSNIERYKESHYHNSIFCALRLAQIKGLEWTIDDFLGYMNVFSHVEDMEYKKFLIDRRESFAQTTTPNYFNYLTLAYLHWLNGNETLSLEAFTKAKSFTGTFTHKSEKIGRDILFESIDDFNKYLFSYISDYGWEITFPNQKEMLKTIKKL